MPRPKILGSSIDVADVGPRQVAALPATKAAAPPLEVRKYCQNGASPSAQYWNQLNEQTNQAALFRPKQVFSYSARLGINGITIGASASGTTNRWRFAFHLGPYSTRVLAHVVMGPPDAGFGTASYGKLTIFSDTAEATPVGTAEFHYGTPPSSSYVNGFQYLKEFKIPIEGLTANTTYYARFDDVDYGQMVCASVFELPSLTEELAGYLPQTLGQESEVLSVYRQNVATVQKNIWKYGAPTILNWTVDPQTAITTTSGTPTNILDQSSTTNSTTSPGFNLVMTGKARRSQTDGVPVVLHAFGKMSAGTDGSIDVVDSSGTTIATIANAWGTTAGWQSVSFNLPATEDKYDLQFYTDSGTFSLYAVSVYEYET